MRREKKPLWRWIGEAILFFLSILAAFYVDNYRDHKVQEALYLKHLQDFRYDLGYNIGSMEFELEDKGDTEGQSGYLTADILLYDSLEAIIKTGDPNTSGDAVAFISSHASQRLSKWIFESPHFDKLSLDYYYFIKNPDLKKSITTHKNDNLHRQESKDYFNASIQELQVLTDNLNFQNRDDRKNRGILFNNQMLNKVSRMTQNYRLIKNLTELNKTRDSLILIEVDKELEIWHLP
ncbi:MAG: hypothetical protein HEP71_20180 [Roseivirga sp.]|nr:hypothetical protein [Roseivirga sp.]